MGIFNKKTTPIKWIHKKDLDLKRYDQMVERFGKSILYAWYLEALTFGKWGVLMMGNYKWIMPLAYHRKCWVKCFYQPFFCRNTQFLTHRPISEIAHHINGFFKNTIQSHFTMPHQINIKGYAQTKLRYQVLSLNSPYEQIRKGYKKNLKRFVSTNKKQQFQINKTSDLPSFLDFFKANTQKKVKYKKRHYLILEKICSKALKNGTGQLFCIKKNEEILAYGYFLFWDKTIMYLKGSVCEKGRKCGAMHVLMDWIIEKHIDNYDVLDFGGSNIESIRRFFMLFNSRDEFNVLYQKNIINKIRVKN